MKMEPKNNLHGTFPMTFLFGS